jgi:hypothetical protein
MTWSGRGRPEADVDPDAGADDRPDAGAEDRPEPVVPDAAASDPFDEHAPSTAMAATSIPAAARAFREIIYRVCPVPGAPRRDPGSPRLRVASCAVARRA